MNLLFDEQVIGSRPLENTLQSLPSVQGTSVVPSYRAHTRQCYWQKLFENTYLYSKMGSFYLKQEAHGLQP